MPADASGDNDAIDENKDNDAPGDEVEPDNDDADPKVVDNEPINDEVPNTDAQPVNDEPGNSDEQKVKPINSEPVDDFKEFYDFYFHQLSGFPEYYKVINENLGNLAILVNADQEDLMDFGLKRLHAKVMMGEIKSLQTEIDEFNEWLKKLKLDSYKQTLQKNYIYTFGLLDRKVKTLDDLIQIIGGSTHKDFAQLMWVNLPKHKKLYGNMETVGGNDDNYLPDDDGGEGDMKTQDNDDEWIIINQSSINVY